MLPALPTPTDADCRADSAGRCPGQPLPPAVPAGAWRWWRPAWSRLERLLSLLQRCVAWAGVLGASAPLPSVPRLLAPLLVVALLLAGCGSAAQPPRRVLLDALALQIRLTQEQVAQALGVPAGGLPEVSRVRVEQQQPVAIGEERGLRLTGRFDWRLAEDPIRVDSPFELYLQRGERGQSWRLARPLADGQDGLQLWLTEPLPLPGERRAGVSASGSGGAA